MVSNFRRGQRPRTRPALASGGPSSPRAAPPGARRARPAPSRGRTAIAWGIPLFLLTGLLVVAAQAQQPSLGPVDGQQLPPTDLARVEVGTVAPDFRLADEGGAIHQLSRYRGQLVVLVVYRGHW